MSQTEMEKIYLEYRGKVMGYLKARIKNRAEAEDLCSDVFEKIYRKLDQFDRSKASLSTWIYSIARNTLIDHFRRMRPSDELDENMADGSEVDESLLRTESLGELADALRSLPRQLMDIIVLRYYDGKQLTEIAELMQISYGAVKLRHQKALTMLKAQLA